MRDELVDGVGETMARQTLQHARHLANRWIELVQIQDNRANAIEHRIAVCEHGVFGACTVLMDGRTVRSCLLFAVQAEGHELTTVEGLAASDGALHPIQQAFHDAHALQCGFCTPGFLLSVHELLESNPDPTELEVRTWLSGNLCRCTGYQNIVEAVLAAAERMRAGSTT